MKGYDLDVGSKKVCWGKKITFKLRPSFQERISGDAELKEVGKTRVESEISKNYNNLYKRLASVMALVMEKGRWTQDIFGDGTVGTSNELDVGANQRQVPIGVKIKHMDSNARLSEFKSQFYHQ